MQIVACHEPPCAGQAIADHDAHSQWHAQQRASDPVEPLDRVLACPACAALIIDTAQHASVCGTRGPADPLGPHVVDWLDSIDVAELDRDSIADAGFDMNVTQAILTQLRKRAAAL